MNIHIIRELKKWKESFDIFWAVMELPILIGLAIYLMFKFPIIVGIILLLSVIVHKIGKKLIENGKLDKLFHRKDTNTGFVGGENYKC